MKYLLTILLCLICYFSIGQTRPTGNPSQFNTGRAKWGWLQADSGTILPIFSALPAWTPTFPFTTIGVRSVTDTIPYFWTGQRWVAFGSGGGGTVTGAINGASLSGANVILGQAYGAGGNPGALTQNTEIPMTGDTLRLLDGFLRIRASQSGGSVPVTIENTFAGASENLHIIGDLASIRMFANQASGFAAITQYSAGTLRNSYGFDGPANHVFLTDLRNGVGSATFEINGTTLAGFSGTTGNLWGGQGTTPDTAALNLFRVGTGLTSSSQQMLLYGANYGSSYNTTGGAITNVMAFLKNSSVRSTGGNNLINTTLKLQSFGAQTNYALLIDSGRVVIHNDFSTTSSFNVDDFSIVDNASSTQTRSAAHLSRSVRYNDLAAGSETFSAAVYAQMLYQAKASVTLPDNISGAAGLESGFFARRNTAYTGAVLFQGSILPTNAVTTMPSALVARFDASVAQTGGNSIRLQGYWAGFTSWAVMNTGNSIGRFSWINTGAAQETGGTIDTGYAIYINQMPSLVTQRYAVRQEGSADSVYLAGVTRHPNLAAQTDTTNFKPMIVSANGTVQRLAFWPASNVSGAATWGTITGTLSAQTDLQAALNLKVNISDTSSMLSKYYRQQGNSFGATAVFGTADNNHQTFISNGTERMRLLSTGPLIIGGTTQTGAFGTHKLEVQSGITYFGDQVFVNTTPFSTSNFFYVTGTSTFTGQMRLASAQIGDNFTASTTGYGISFANTSSSIRFQGNPGGANQTTFLMNYWTGTTATLGGTASSTSNVLSIQAGFGDAGNTGQSGNVLDIQPVYNQTTANATTFRGIYYHPTLTSLTSTTHIAYENTTGNLLFNSTSGNANFGTTISYSTTVSSAGTLTLGAGIVYVFTNTTATWTLPAVSGTTGRMYVIKSRGSGNITLNSNSGSEIYDTAAQTSITVIPGQSITLISDGTYWLVN